MMLAMNRRELLKCVSLLGPLMKSPAIWAKVKQPEIAFTFDDPRTDSVAGLSWQEINERILAALSRHRIKATLFVTGKRVDSDAGRTLVSAWDQAGHAIGNHSYSHLFFNNANITLDQFESDVLRNEPLIQNCPHFLRLFRFPYFKEGETIEKRDGMRSFLRNHGYRIGRATIDTSDWAIASRLEKRLSVEPQADTVPYREFFKAHIWNRAQFYNSLATRVLRRRVRHTVLLHHNALSAFFLGALIDLFLTKGWKPIDAVHAYADRVYDLQPNVLPAGESIIWALAKQSGKFDSELRYPGEDDVYENPKMDALKL
jgi:peptidoglycan/xylan/chitin deacetylase (PgdA/CDA1 family)